MNQNTSTVSNPQERISKGVKRLVIELGYLEHCIAEGILDPNIQVVINDLNAAIDNLNTFLRP